ncbi:MAG: response regulator transcription factor [Thermodesulfovibrionales bacterium]|nr:response regulator transcription factor [Thermodesulfovibrionales bacterium]
MALKVAICCSTRLFSEALQSLLEKEQGITLTGIFSGESWLSDLKEADAQYPDVIVSDLHSDLSALLTLPDDFFVQPRLKILLLGDRTSGFITNRDLKNLIAKGVIGILPPSADSDLFKKALRAVSAGEIWLDRTTLMKILTLTKQTTENVRLAQREKEIIHHICQGYRNKEIAQKLNISEQTVKSHCNRIYKKLGVTDRLHLALHYSELS